MILSPHPDSERLTRALERCLPLAIPWSGVVYRSTSPRYATVRDLLGGVGSKLEGGRWTPKGGFEAIYTSLEPETMLAETLVYHRRTGIPTEKAMPRVIVSIRTRLHHVLNLMDGTVRYALGISQRRMREEPWRDLQKRDQEALTQAVARLAWSRGLEGLLVPSAVCVPEVNLVIFPSNLVAKSRLRVINATHLPGPP